MKISAPWRGARWPGFSRWVGAGLLAVSACACTSLATNDDPLPSWADGPARHAIVEFVNDVTRDGSPNYVPPAQRIATFDNDGTLWAEQPMYTQFAFMIDQVKSAAARNPQWSGNPVYKALAANDLKAALAQGEKPLLDLLVQANSGMTVDDYEKTVRQWFATAQHPTLKRPYTETVYQPQLELLKYLRAKGFKTFIVSGGTMEVMRPWTEQAYGIAPEQVVGSSQAIEYSGNELVRRPKLHFVDDGPGKPVGIYMHIGQRPILAFGNSDGDLQMLQYTTAGSGRRLGLIVHHDDGEREFAYDRRATFGKLDKALDEAPRQNWVVVSMKKDWKQVFPLPPSH